MSNSKYSILPWTQMKQSSESSAQSDATLLDEHVEKVYDRRGSSFRHLPWVITAASLLLSLVLLVDSTRMHSTYPENCVAKHSIWSPALEIVNDDYETMRYSGSIQNGSPFKGPPNPSVDAAWDNLTSVGTFAIGKEDLIKIGGDPEFAVTYPDDVGGGAGGMYMADLEVFHQIHCVNLLWQTTYPDYYTEIRDDFKIDEHTLRNHLDHCADLLRQSLMCDADVSVLHYEWVEFRDIPYPNFSTLHKCRNFDDILQWGRDKEVPRYRGGRFLKPPGTKGRADDP